jgi:hypothetical protein
MQEKGAEFGATTGRKRRCGWLDLVVLRESQRLNGPTEIALTKLDVLGGLDELKLCTAYRYKGQEVAYPPQEENGMAYVEPVYESMPGWKEDISGCRTYAELPQATRDYIERIEADPRHPGVHRFRGPGPRPDHSALIGEVRLPFFSHVRTLARHHHHPAPHRGVSGPAGRRPPRSLLLEGGTARGAPGPWPVSGPPG